jgi:predicted dinucleotide-binding enzyme
MPPTLIPQYANSWSMGEAIQQLCPETFVVKTLNMVNCEVMVNAALAGDNASMFVCGNDSESKLTVSKLLEEFGWNDIIDLGVSTHPKRPTRPTTNEQKNANASQN